MAGKEMRAVYCDTLKRLAATNKNIVVVEADLMKASGTMPFKDAFPERGIDVGVAEANLVGVASGLSVTGKIPFAATFGCFATRRAYDQFFISANYARLNVKLVGTDPGVTAAFNGGTHMPFEDMGLARAIPELVVFEPSDPVSLEKMVELSAAHKGCSYMRLHRKPIEPIYKDDEKFEFGKGKVLRDGGDVTIIAMGAVMVPEALKAADILSSEGKSAAVIDILTLKPLDRELVLKYAEKTGRIVTAENHRCQCGLFGAVAELLAAEKPTRMAGVGVGDEFGEVGTQEWLMKRFGLTAEDIANKAMSLINK